MTHGPSASSPMRTLPRPRTRTSGALSSTGFLEGLHARDLVALGVEGVDRAGDARVERVDRAEDLERPFRVRHRVAHEGGLVRAHLSLFVARARVPRGGHDGLVVRDLAVLDDDPVRERAARRLVKAEPALLALREYGLVE